MKERNYGIDLLRLLLMYFVCMLHTLGQGGVLKAFKVGTIGYNVFWLLEIISYCAVDGFAMISGYTASKKNRKYEKLIEMWLQAFFYSFILTGIFVIIGMKQSWNLEEILEAAMPVSTGKFWYFTAFFALYFAMPMFNQYFLELDKNTARKALVLLFLLYSVMEVNYKTFDCGSGYSTIWLMVMYCMGLLIQKSELFKNKSVIQLIILWGICIGVTWYEYVFAGKSWLVNYVSPTILLSGIILVVLFSRIRLKGTILSKVTPLVFGIYLFQMNEVIWKTVLKNAFRFIGTESIIVGVIYAFLGAFTIFFSGLLVEFLRNFIVKTLRISMLSRKMVEGINYMLCKLFFLIR